MFCNASDSSPVFDFSFPVCILIKGEILSLLDTLSVVRPSIKELKRTTCSISSVRSLSVPFERKDPALRVYRQVQ